MTEILSNLLGEIVEVTSVEYEGGKTHTYVNARGKVCAIYPMERSGMCIVVENDRQEPVGRLLGYDMYVHAVRRVRLCELCGLWDHPDKMFVREGETGANSAPTPTYECRKHRSHGG